MSSCVKEGPFLLIIYDRLASYHILPKLTEGECNHLDNVEGFHFEDVCDPKDAGTKARFESMCYVHAALGFMNAEELREMEITNVHDCINVIGKWEDTQVPNLRVFNETYGGDIKAVFCFDNSQI